MAEPDRWERWAPLSGIVFAVVFLGLFFGGGETPSGASAEELAQFYRDQGEAGTILLYFLAGLSGAAFIWFTGSLRAALRRVEPPPARLSAVAFGAGVASAVLLLVGGSSFLAPAAAVIGEQGISLDPTLHNVVSSAGFIAINFALLSSAVMIAAASLAALRFGGLPTWFAWVGFLVALALALNIFYFFGFFVWIAWVLVAAIVLLVRPVVGPPAAA